MSGLQMTTENTNISSIIEQIKASHQKVLQAFEDHNSLVNKSLELLQQLKTETKVEVVKVKDPLEELKIVRDEFDKEFLTDTDLEPIKKSTKKWLESTYENSRKNICRAIGWIESIIFKNCENVKSVNLHFQDVKDEITFKYSLDETSNECILYFGSPDSSRIINNTIHTSMFPSPLLPYQSIYFTCEKIDETKPCYATMMYRYYDIVVPCKLVKNRIIFTIQDKKLLITFGSCVPYENEDIDLVNSIKKINERYKDREFYGYLSCLVMINIVNCLCLYESAKISTSFKEIFLKLFNKCLPFKNDTDHLFFNGKSFKNKVLKVRDIRWLLLEMEKYPQYFQFTEDDLNVMKENGASRDNIYLVKKFLKKDGDYEEYYPEEEGGGIKCRYHMTGGHLEGEYNFWYPAGQLWGKRYYKDGKKEGEAKEWYEDGTLLYQICYKDGEPEGEFKRWHDNGQLMYQKHFKEGKFEGEHTYWNEYGTLKEQHYYKEGHLELKKLWIENDTYELTRYYECDGKLQDQVIMVGGKWNGKYNSLWHNGNKCIETTYKDDKIHGEYTYWNEDGTLKEQCVYENGVKV